MNNAAVSDQAHLTELEHGSAVQDAAVQLLWLAARLYAARGDPATWIAILRACRDQLGCFTTLDLPHDARLLRPEDLEALAGRVTHCAGYGNSACGDRAEDALRRARCAAFAAHLHEAAIAHRWSLQAAVFDQLPPTWIVDREAYVLVANTPAKTVIAMAGHLTLGDGRLVPDTAGAAEKLRRTLREVTVDVRFAWPTDDGSETILLLRPLAGNRAVAAMLLTGPLAPDQLARQLASALALTTRQSELAAHLLAGLHLSDAARKMAISRHTANEHLAALLRRTGSADRKALMALLLRIVRP